MYSKFFGSPPAEHREHAALAENLRAAAHGKTLRSARSGVNRRSQLVTKGTIRTSLDVRPASIERENGMVSEERASRRILVIDDDEVMRELLAALLEVQGYEVQLAPSGEDGLVQLREPEPPAMILTDLQMPGLEGEELTVALRAAAPSGATLVGMSGRAPGDALVASLDAFLSKPFSAQQLEEAFVTGQAARAASDASGSAPKPAVNLSPEHSSAEDNAVLDESIFTSLARSFRPEQLRELYGLTLDDVAQRHARMVAHAAEDDLGAVQREAHAIKGACGMVGARELQHLAGAAEGGTTLNTSALAELPSACDRLRRILDAKLQQ